MGIFSATTYPSGGYAVHMNSDPLSSNRIPVTYTHGLANYYETFGGGRNRWGDFSATCIDPRNDTDFWTIQESSYVGAAPNWYTWWASVQPYCPKPASPVVASSPGVICAGRIGTYYLDSIPGATTYEWIVAGTGWTGASTVDSINLFAGTGVATVTVLAYNACGEGEPLTLNLTPGEVPATAPTITMLTPACLDSPITVLSVSELTYPAISSYYWEAVSAGWSGTGSLSSFTDSIGTSPDTIICNVSNSCGTSPNDTFIVTPAVPPTSEFTIENHVTEINTNDVITFSGTAPTGCTYIWNFGSGYGSVSPGGTVAGPQTVVYPTPGLETLTLKVINAGCPSGIYTDTILVIDTALTAINNMGLHQINMTIIPNPNEGSFEIAFDNPINNSFVVKIADMQGRVVYNTLYKGTTNNKVSIDSGNLPSGIYTVSVYVNNVPATQKITITR